MEFTTLEATRRETGKRGSKASRRTGNVPCTLYGRHVEPTSFQVSAGGIDRLVRSHETNLVKIELDGQSWECILKDVDFHPVWDQPIHADFQVLQAGEKISLTVPFRFEGIPVGQITGGNTQYVMNEAEIICLPKDIPSHLTVDISELDIGDGIHISDLEFEGIEFQAFDSQTVVMVHAPRLIVEEEEEVLEEGEEIEGEEGDAEGTQAPEEGEE